jgi:hypothetical protein
MEVCEVSLAPRSGRTYPLRESAARAWPGIWIRPGAADAPRRGAGASDAQR